MRVRNKEGKKNENGKENRMTSLLNSVFSRRSARNVTIRIGTEELCERVTDGHSATIMVKVYERNIGGELEKRPRRGRPRKDFRSFARLLLGRSQRAWRKTQVIISSQKQKTTIRAV